MRLLALAAAVVALVGFAGVVGGASKQTAAEARYALEIEAWCARWWAEYAALGQPETMPEWASLLARMAPLVSEQGGGARAARASRLLSRRRCEAPGAHLR